MATSDAHDAHEAGSMGNGDAQQPAASSPQLSEVPPTTGDGRGDVERPHDTGKAAGGAEEGAASSSAPAEDGQPSSQAADAVYIPSPADGPPSETTPTTTTTSSASTSSPPEPPAADAPTRQVRRLPPPPKKGILRPPSSSHAASSRFSFRRDFLQPFNTSYSRATTTADASAGAGAAGAAPASVGEVMGNAAATAGGFFGSALKRLTAAAAPPEDPSASTTVAPPPAVAPAPAPAAPAAAPAPAAPPAAAPAPQLALPVADLKRVRFRMASLKLVYPINGGTLDVIAPADEGATRERVESEWRVRHLAPAGTGVAGPAGREGKVKMREKDGGEKEGAGKRWTGDELLRLYAECCRTREEPGIERVKRAFKENPAAPPKALDLSNELLSRGAVEALSDLLAIDFGLKKLTLDHCGLDDESLRPLLHALLVSASIPTVSLAGNKRIRARGWKFIATFLRKATFLRYIDLSETPLDRRAAEYLVQALAPAPPPAPPPPPPSSPPPLPDKPDHVASSAASAAPAPAPQKKVAGPWDEDDESDAEEEGEAVGAVAANGEAHEVEPQAVVVAEEKADEVEVDEDEEPEAVVREPLFETAPLLKENKSGAPAAVLSLRLENCGLRGATLEVLAPGVRVSDVKHISLRKNRINAAGAVALAVLIRDYPLSSDPSSTYSVPSAIPFGSAASLEHKNGTANVSDSASTSSFSLEVTNSVSARQRDRALSAPPQPAVVPAPVEQDPELVSALGEREAWRLSEARLRLRKQLDGLPRIGALLTLDVRGNDIRSGVTYIAQVLKRNRTLKVLNLGENKIDPQGLVALAEALKFNTTLETLDMGHNPCCGPLIDGILALRSAMMVSPSLKRVFLNSTDLSSEGAIALAEFLPEAHSLLHLDLTNNNVDISGVLALSVSIKLNSTIRCLDINIPFDDPDFSRLSQDLLETCVRNTELAQQKADAEARDAAAKRVVVAQPIRKSALASNLEARQQAEQRRAQRRDDALRAQGDIFAAAAETRDVVSQLLAVEQAAGAREASEVVRDALVQLQLAEAQLAEAFSGARQAEQRERAEVLLTELASLLDLAKNMFDRPPPSLSASNDAPAVTAAGLTVPAPADVDNPPASPTFSLQDSDEEEADTADAARPAAADGSTLSNSAPSLSVKPATLLLPDDSSPSSSSGPSSPSLARSPIESESRAMVAEEGEMFRKGVALGVDEVGDESDDEGAKEVSGEELKKELLETTVQRSPRPSFNSDDTPRPSLANSLARPPSDSVE